MSGIGHNDPAAARALEGIREYQAGVIKEQAGRDDAIAGVIKYGAGLVEGRAGKSNNEFGDWIITQELDRHPIFEERQERSAAMQIAKIVAHVAKETVDGTATVNPFRGCPNSRPTNIMKWWRDKQRPATLRQAPSTTALVAPQNPPEVSQPAIPPRHTTKTPAQPNAKKIQRVFLTPDSDDWKEVVPSKDMNNLLGKYADLVDTHNELIREYNELRESHYKTLKGLADEYDELLDNHNDLEADYDSLKDVVSKHGLDWWEGMPALRITDAEKANEWFKHALAYYAEWNRARVEGPISDEEFKRVSEELKRIHDDFYAHYREDDFSEGETPPGAPASEQRSDQ